MFYNKEPLPANESNQLAFERCSTIEGAKEFCPKRWEALQNWFKASREVINATSNCTGGHNVNVISGQLSLISYGDGKFTLFCFYFLL